MKKTIPAKMEKFIRTYSDTHDLKKSVVDAGYTLTRCRTYGMIGRELLNNPTVKNRLVEIEEIKRMDAEAQKLRVGAVKEMAMTRINDKIATVLDIYDDLLSHKDLSPRLRFDVAKDLLDRAGFKPTEKRELTGADGGPIRQENSVINEVADRARKLMVVNGGLSEE